MKKSKLRIVVIVLGVLVGLVAAMVVGAALWLKNYKQTEYPDVEFIVPEGGVREIIEEYESYPPAADPDGVVATIGDKTLTNAQLQVYFWAMVAAHCETEEVKPDLRVPLVWQKCPLDDSVESWEQYFLQKAVDTWHGVQALTMQGDNETLPREERYDPDEALHEQYMTDKPATAYLYGYDESYRINTLHESFIEQLPTLLDELAQELGYSGSEDLAQAVFGTTEAAVLEAADIYNRGYSYYTTLSYLLGDEAEAAEEADAEASDESDEAHAEETAAAEGTPLVSFRQILLRPEHPTWYPKKMQEKDVQVEYSVDELGRVTCVETGWTNCMNTAKNLLHSWDVGFMSSEYTFAQLAYEKSADEGSQLHGGYYGNMPKGEVLPELEEWLFDPARQPEDTTIIRTEYGVHILYFCEGTTVEQKAAEDADTADALEELIENAKKLYPMEVDLTKAAIQPGSAEVTFSDLLYADIAHERYPEVPLYLQRDYGNTMYGGYRLATHGCGITSMAMLATYLADEEWTPPELCDIFGSYCGLHGTDVRLFWQANSVLGYFYRGYVYDDDEAWQALQDGYLVVAKESAGYWTRGGHYIVLEKLTEDDKVVVRDSNIFNFGTLEGHSVDYFDWEKITPQAVVYFIMGKKPTHIAACIRCGDPGEKTVELIGDSYICPNCDTAMLRRDTFLNGLS